MVGLVVVGALLAGACDVQVTERFRSDGSDASNTTTTDITSVDGSEESTSTTLPNRVGDGVAIPEDTIAGVLRLALGGRPVDMVATMRWSQRAESSEFELRYESLLRLELTLLRVAELERLGVLGADEEPNPRVRWYAIAGSVGHQLRNAECVPADDVEDCDIASVTDGGLLGLASREDDVVNIAVVWRLLGRSALPDSPSVGVRLTDSTGRTIVGDHQFVKQSLEEALIVGGSGTALRVGDANGLLISASDGEGRLVIVDRN